MTTPHNPEPAPSAHFLPEPFHRCSVCGQPITAPEMGMLVFDPEVASRPDQPTPLYIVHKGACLDYLEPRLDYTAGTEELSAYDTVPGPGDETPPFYLIGPNDHPEILHPTLATRRKKHLPPDAPTEYFLFIRNEDYSETPPEGHTYLGLHPLEFLPPLYDRELTAEELAEEALIPDSWTFPETLPCPRCKETCEPAYELQDEQEQAYHCLTCGWVFVLEKRPYLENAAVLLQDNEPPPEDWP